MKTTTNFCRSVADNHRKLAWHWTLKGALMHPSRPTICLVVIAAAALVSIGALSLSDQGVRFPDGSVLTSAHNVKDVAIPVGSLFPRINTFVSNGQLLLSGSGNSIIEASWVVPADHEPGTDVYVYLHVYNEAAVCQAKIIAEDGGRYRSGLPANSIPWEADSDFPPFLLENTTVVHEYYLGFLGAGDAVAFAWLRQAGDASDSCAGPVQVVGVNVRYTRS